MTRHLTSQEIENILDFIVPRVGIPEETANAIAEANKERLRKQLRTQEVYPEIIPLLKQQMETVYTKSQVQPGESLGILCAQSIGEKNTQLTLNSVDWSEKLLYTENGKTIIEPIGELIDRTLNEHTNNITFIEENRTQYLPLHDGYYIPSSDENGMCSWYRIEAVTKHLPVGKLVKVITESGRSVMATQSKSFLVWDGQKFANTLGSNIKIGDALPTTHTLLKPKTIREYFDMESIFSKDKYLYTTELIKAREYKQSGEFKWWTNHIGKDFILPYKSPDICFGKRNEYFTNCEPGLVYINTSNSFESRIPDKIPLDKDFGFIIGIYLAEGRVSKTFIRIKNNEEVVRRRITNFCDRYRITYRLVTSNDLKVHSTLLARMLKIICDTGLENKKVPEFAYTAPSEFIKGLIDGYFSANGVVNEMDGSISVSSISEGLIVGISFLLSYFGIFARVCNRQSLENNIDSNDIKISFIIRISNDFAKTFAREISITELRKQEKLNTVTLVKEYKYKYGHSQVDYPDRDVYFDKVISIEYVEGTTEYVYDLTVEETRNFQLWNGLNCADTFHKAGQSEKGITAGVPRFQELLNATKCPKLVSCRVFFKQGAETIRSLRKTIGHSIVGLTFKDLTTSMKVVINKEEELWYESFKALYDDNFTKYSNCISVKLNMKLLFEYKLTMRDIASVISNEYDDVSCVFSPPRIGQFDIFVDTSVINLPEDRLLFIDTENAPLIYLEETVQYAIEKMFICGIPGITNIYYMQEGDEWMVDTDGSNFKKLLAHPAVDMKRVISNNVWEIYETLGIEAAREFLIEEYMSIMEGISMHHTKLLVERMTYSGTISSISRYTMRKDETGPMGKASFEESVDNFLKAASYGDVEPTNGVSASIICGKRANVGTGMMDLRVDIGRLPGCVPIIKKQVKELKNISNK